MAVNPNKLSKFWQELKRRRVVQVTIVYASAAILIIDLIGNVTEPLHLPEWTPTLIIVLLAIGFPVALIFSWIFDVTPEGIEKTKSVEAESGADNQPPEKPESGSNGWKLATYISISVLLVVLIWHIYGRNNRDKSVKASDLSIAILPVKNLSGDPEQQFMCEGLTREIISQLYLISSFEKVVPFQTMRGYEDSDESTRVIAEELGVDYILDLSYIKVGQQVNLTGDLVNAIEDRVIWTSDYHREYKLIMSLQNDIALEVADKLNAFMTGEEENRVNRNNTENLHAYELVQKSIYYFFNQRDPNFHIRDSLLRAIELDPTYANAYALIATYSIFGFAEPGGPIADFSVDEAKHYNSMALSLDPENLAAILNQAMYEQWVNWDYVEAENYYRKAFSIAPNTRFYYLISSYIDFLMKMNRFEDIPPYLNRLDEHLSQEPLVYSVLGQQAKADEIAHILIMNQGVNRIFALEYYVWEERYNLITTFLDTLSGFPDLYESVPMLLAFGAIAYQETGAPSIANDLVAQLRKMSDSSWYGMPELNLSRYYSGIGEVDSAFYWLGRAYQEQCVDMTWLKADRLLKKLHSDERYWDFYNKCGFKKYDEYRDSLQAGRP